MMILAIKLSNILNLIAGIILGFIIAIFICSKFFKKLLKSNSNHDKYLKQIFSKEKKVNKDMTKSLISVIDVIAIDANSNSINPKFEFSFNKIINTAKNTVNKLNKIFNHFILNNLKYISINNIINIDKIYKPISKILKDQDLKLLYYLYYIIRIILNIFNPFFYLKLILSKILYKNGLKTFKDSIILFYLRIIFELYN